jgi:hypothetical protein
MSRVPCAQMLQSDGGVDMFLRKGDHMARSKIIGALWLKESRDGMKYMSGTLDLGAFGEVPIAIFRITEKRNERGPDYNIVLSEPKPPAPEPANEEVVADEDIPF